jgi:hypothetical protein
MKIRKFQLSDAERCVEILKLNNQYSHPLIDGPEAMKRIYEKQDDLFLIAEYGDLVVGMVRGCYDGSRALVWQISVHPEYQMKGIGRSLMKEIAKVFKEMGAPYVSVTARDSATKYYEKLGFLKLPIDFMLLENIDDLLKD